MGALKLFQTKLKEIFSPKKKRKHSHKKVAKKKSSHLKVVPKTTDHPKQNSNSSADKAEIERLQSLIQGRLEKNPNDIKKAAMIIEKMINNKKK